MIDINAVNAQRVCCRPHAPKEGQAIGTLNLLGAAHQYDDYNADAALVLSRLAAPYLLAALQTQRRKPLDGTALDSI